MINILSLSCSLAFAPYLIDAMSVLENGGAPPSRTVRQGGSGMILALERSLSLIHRGRRADLDNAASRHYLATIRLRAKSYDVRLTSEEVVLASVNGSLLVSYPQSEIWLEGQAVTHLVASYRSGVLNPNPVLPDWLRCSVAAGRLLLSDQRSGRWVLLGTDHIAELERRLGLLTRLPESPVPSPSIVQMKGVQIHLQSAFKLGRALREFGETREVRRYEEAAPEFKLNVAPASEGIQISDSNARIGVTPREALKWAGIIEAELTRLNATEMVRGQITTVIADGPGGQFVLQWGDEVFLPAGFWDQESRSDGQTIEQDDRLIRAAGSGFTILLDRANSSCVALTSEEISRLKE